MNNHDYEKTLLSKGYKLIAGVDEVGRGCIAGPVVASAVIMPPNSKIEGVMDSKKLTDHKRRILKEKIEQLAISHATIFIDEEIVDKINILEATKLAMSKAVYNLEPQPDYILIDALKLELDVPTAGIIKGDDHIFSIACASIIAKVNRDDYMIELDKKYPQYGFKNHKGYPTKKHIEALTEHGVLSIHRKSYAPVMNIIKAS